MAGKYSDHDKQTYAPRKKQALYVKRRCHRCAGTGHAPCPICSGSGQAIKGKDFNGRLQFGRCDGCFGNKTRLCSACNGEGMA